MFEFIYKYNSDIGVHNNSFMAFDIMVNVISITVELIMIKIFVDIFMKFTDFVIDESDQSTRVKAKITISIITILLLTRSFYEGLHIYQMFYTKNHEDSQEIEDIVSYNELLGGSITFFCVYSTCFFPTFVGFTMYYVLYLSGTQFISKSHDTFLSTINSSNGGKESMIENYKRTVSNNNRISERHSGVPSPTDDVKVSLEETDVTNNY